MKYLKKIGVIFIVVFTIVIVANKEQKTQAQIPTVEKPNVLIIFIDDLRPELNCFGKSHIKSPNIDALANNSMVFTNAYASVPVCGASRASILTGLHPTYTRFVDYGARVDEDAPNSVTMPEHFKNNGYYTCSIGKIFHHPDDALEGWSEMPCRPDYPNTLKQQELWRDYQSEENEYTKKTNLPLGAAGPAWESANVSDDAYYDGKTAAIAVEKINLLAKSNKPFLLGVGFIRPHLPFNAPKKYWDMYNEEEIDLAENDFFPLDAPVEAKHNYGELRSYTNISNDTIPIPASQAKKLRHGYYASVSYVDAQIGEIIRTLKENNLYDNTIVLLSGDHGWNLGEHALWCKQSCFTNALITPLIVKKVNETKGRRTTSLISMLDIYPTLCELTNVKEPEHLDGNSFAEILNSPNHIINKYVYARFHNAETIKSKQFSYTQYLDSEGRFISDMLYDNLSDPQENINLAHKKEFKTIVEDLKSTLNKHINIRG
ncbi:sulfatase [Joostella atrarenae]|uniref:Sulfatase n=1 Tax=Joostella atrarenae TaxID=679257 RepID=A0ABS9J2Z4_9FLAO|nr:sulfatase [Joostella atrarenae]MCF8714720.1 sulfatase [Joostella atrarenae]